jgi:hypothetical protein
MTKYLTWLVSSALFVGVINASTVCQAASIKQSEPHGRLVALAAAQFQNLTKAERALLWFSDVKNIDRGEIAVAGTSSNPADPSNDPAHADQWDKEREVRAALIRWMCVDPDAIKLIDPFGIRVMGGRIVGGLNLSHVRVPAPLELRNCSIREEISFDSAELPELTLNGSHTVAIYAPSIKVTGTLQMGHGFDAAAEVFMHGARIDGDADFHAGRFRYSIAPRGLSPAWLASESQWKTALNLKDSQIRGTVWMSLGFQSEGAIDMNNVSISGDLIGWGAHFLNPNNVAIWAPASVISHDVHLSDVLFGVASPQFAEVNGLVEFTNAQIGGGLDVVGVKFRGGPSDQHGLDAQGASIKEFLTQGASFTNDAIENVSGAQIEFIVDNEASWPKHGKLNISGLKYQGFGQSFGSPVDVASRLRWLRLNETSSDPQPYDQLAKYYRGVGDIDSATQVLIARDDVMYSRSGPARRVWGKFLKITVGYGHRPLRAIVWSLAVVLLGSVVVGVGARAGVMRATWPENRPLSESVKFYERLSPLLYSLDVFLPFVNLHQEHYWWPEATASGKCVILGRSVPIRGEFLRYYLWLQIIAGWLLSAIFIAGVTGLIRND